MRRDHRNLGGLRFLTASAWLIGPRHHADDLMILIRRCNQPIEDAGRQLRRAHEDNFQRRRRVQIWTEGGLAFS